MLSGAGLSFASDPLVLAILGICAIAALTARWVRKTIRAERVVRLAAERSAAQSYRLAQSTAAFGHARTSTDAMATAIHEPLHWLRAGAGVFYLLSDDRSRLNVAFAVGYPLDHIASWKIDEWGEGSPFIESLRRLTPVVIKSAKTRAAEYAAWSNAGPWKNHEACLVLPIAIERHVIGFLQVDFDTPREFSTDDHEYIHILCSRTAQTLQRMWWYESVRSEEHTSELQSLAYLVCRLLLEKK